VTVISENQFDTSAIGGSLPSEVLVAQEGHGTWVREAGPVTIPAGLSSDAELAQRSARIRLPGWLAEGNLQEFGRTCRWRMAPTNLASGEWEVRLDERVRRKPGHIVQVNRLATKSNVDKAGAYSRLSRLPREAALFKDVPYGQVQAELNRLGGQRPDDLAALMYRVTLATGTAAPDHLADIVRQVLRDFLLPVLSDAAVDLVEVDLALGRRYGLVRLLRQAQDDETMFLRPPALGSEPIFNSARWLFSDTSLGLGAYLAPLYLALAPWVWAAPAKRPGGVVIYTFGCLAAGRRSEASELLQLFFPEGRAQSGPKPEVSPADMQAAVIWWIDALDRLFTEVTDPVRYVGDDGKYSVKENFEALLSLEQVFRNVQSLSAQARDNHVRRTLLFDTLDMIEGFRRSPDFAKMCELSYAQRALKEVTGLLSPQAGRVLLPRAKQAVAALQQLQNGFFASSRLKDGGLRVPNKNGNGERVVSLEAAAASYIRVLRNGGHAFGGRTVPADGIYLLAHDGDIPIDLPDLAYLYLLHLLAYPQVLRRRTAPGQGGGT
jgi:hypothetical protein